MNKFVLKIGNLKEITKKLNKNQKKILNKNVCNPTLKYFLVNAAMINFKKELIQSCFGILVYKLKS